MKLVGVRRIVGGKQGGLILRKYELIPGTRGFLRKDEELVPIEQAEKRGTAMELRIYEIAGFFLSDEWKPKGEIFFAIRGGADKTNHKKFCEQQKKKLLLENDNDHSRWVFTGEICKYVCGISPYATIIAFRVRDAW